MTKVTRAVVSTLAIYFVSILILGSGPLFLETTVVMSVAGIVIGILVVVGTYWAYRLVGRGFFRRALVILVGWTLLSTAFSMAMYLPVYAPGVTTTGLAQDSGLISQPSRWTGRYSDTCQLTAGHDQDSQASDYNLVSYGRAQAFSQAHCTGIGYIRTETFASGVDASARAKASIWFIDKSIFVPNVGRNYSMLNLLLDFTIAGWQATRDSPGLDGHSSVTLNYEISLIRDDGYHQVSFNRIFDGAHSFGGGYQPVYNNIPVQQGHSYSIVVAFNVTSYSAVLGPMGMTHSWSCYQADPVCDQTPPDMFDTGFCSQGVQVSQGKCFAFEWSSTDYNVTAI